jgi:hypothetical protein
MTVAIIPFVFPTHANRRNDSDPRKLLSVTGKHTQRSKPPRFSFDTYTIPRLMVKHKPTFSTLRISNDRVINQGKDAIMKSMMML